jgi:hypothetical protein
MAKKVKRKRSKGSTSSSPSLPHRVGTEAMLADLSRIMREQEFTNLDDAQVFMNRLLDEGGGRLPPSEPQSPAERAQAFAYQAWETPTDSEAAALARQALAIYPDCAEAYNVLAETDARSVEEACDFYRQGVDAGRRSLGEEFFAENAVISGVLSRPGRTCARVRDLPIAYGPWIGNRTPSLTAKRC